MYQKCAHEADFPDLTEPSSCKNEKYNCLRKVISACDAEILTKCMSGLMCLDRCIKLDDFQSTSKTRSEKRQRPNNAAPNYSALPSLTSINTSWAPAPCTLMPSQVEISYLQSSPPPVYCSPCVMQPLEHMHSQNLFIPHQNYVFSALQPLPPPPPPLPPPPPPPQQRRKPQKVQQQPRPKQAPVNDHVIPVLQQQPLLLSHDSQLYLQQQHAHTYYQTYAQYAQHYAHQYNQLAVQRYQQQLQQQLLLSLQTLNTAPQAKPRSSRSKPNVNNESRRDRQTPPPPSQQKKPSFHYPH